MPSSLASGQAPLWVRVASRCIRRLPVGRYRAAHALGRWRRTPFQARLPRDLGAFVFHCDLGDEIAREVCFTGRYEPQQTQIAAALVKRGDAVVDVGANWGYFTLASAHWTGAQGRVIALEPEPRLFSILHANVRSNGLRHVSIHQNAAGASAGIAPFVAYGAGMGNRGVTRTASAGERPDFYCDTVTIDAVLDREGIGDVRLVKIDVEGAEADVLLGMVQGLARRRYSSVVVECHPQLLESRGLTILDVLTPFDDARYTLLEIDQSPARYREAARRVVPLRRLVRPLRRDAAPGRWPHLLAIAPGVELPA